MDDAAGRREDAYAAFLAERVGRDASDPLTSIYHAVRTVPYGAVGQRDPVAVIGTNRGSCSAKHLLLRDLLRHAGFEAGVATMFTHFESRMAPHASFPAELNALIEAGGVCDYHHYVLARPQGSSDEAWVKLDATWHDRLEAYGFPVNSGWHGAGDTELASVPLTEYPPVEDLVSFKAELVASLPPDERHRRERFFALFTGWIDGIERSGT